MELFVILAASGAPDVAAWNESLAAARTSVRITEEVQLSRHSGFVPVTVNGQKTGFYFLAESYSELAAQYPAIAKIKVDEPVVYSLGYGGDLNECAAVFLAASALVERFGGTAFEPQAGIVMGARELRDAGKQCQDMAKQ
jgi:hypothetical protein